MSFKVKDGQTYLFQGDSITDAGRRGADSPFGSGYARMFIDKVVANHPERSITFVNRGIGGHSVVDLQARWEDDAINVKPDWLSIMIGVNDLHRSILGRPEPISPELYREAYDNILSRTLKAGKCGIVLIEPFYISQDMSGSSHRTIVLGMLPDYIAVVREMAKKHGTLLVNTHDIFQEHLKYRDPNHFCPEPVHPNPAGHAVIAEALYKALC